jgi:DNA topoisomerase-1
LPAVKVGEILKLEKLDPSQHFTKPPARFTEASLVKELEKRSIGRPRLMQRLFLIQERGYVKLENRRLLPKKWVKLSRIV